MLPKTSPSAQLLGKTLVHFFVTMCSLRMHMYARWSRWRCRLQNSSEIMFGAEQLSLRPVVCELGHRKIFTLLTLVLDAWL